MTQRTTRVMLVDDHTLVREGIRHILQGTPGFEVIAEAGDGETALRLAQSTRPDLVVLDLSLPGLSGLEVTTRIRESLPEIRVLILSVHDHQEYVLGAVRAGAQGYLRKDTSPAELREALQAVARGESYFSPPVARHLSAAVRGEPSTADAGSRLDRLTPRERLGLSPRTVESYRESLARKLDIKTVAGLTRFAIEEGLVRE